MSFLDKAKDMVGKNIDKVEQAIDKAGDLVDEKTGGKFTPAVDKVQETAKDVAGKVVHKDNPPA